MRRALGCLALLASSLPPPLWADETASALPPVDVIAEPAATDFSAVSDDDLEATPALGLTELLRQLPGVHVDRMGARGAVSSLYLRGADPNFTAVYIDGVKVNDPTNTRGGSTDLSTLLADDVERIELLSGPASALLGADALAGAINIVTRRGDGSTGGAARIAGGGFGQRTGSARQLGSVLGTDYALSAGHVESGTAVEGSSAELTSFGLNVDASLPVQLSLRHSRGILEAFPEDSGGPRYAALRERDHRDTGETSIGARSQWFEGAAMKLLVEGSAYEREELAVSPGVAPGARDPAGIPASRSDARLRRLDARAALSGAFAALSLTGGAQAGREEGFSDGELSVLGLPLDADFALARDHTALFLDADYLWDSGLLAEASIRRDDHGAHVPVTRRARLSYPVGKLTLSGGYGEGFKLPSFYALGNPTVGNPDLQPESSHSGELALLYAWSATTTLRLVAFDARYRNAIDFDEGPPPRLVNRDLMTCRGLELSSQVALLDTLDWRLGATRAIARLPGSEEQLRNRPRWTGFTQARWRLPREITAVLGAVHVGANLDSSVATGDRVLPAYTRWDGALEWALLPRLGLRVAVENLADADYEELVGFPGPRRTGRVELTTSL